jgi:hypothetical protein
VFPSHECVTQPDRFPRVPRVLTTSKCHKSDKTIQGQRTNWLHRDTPDKEGLGFQLEYKSSGMKNCNKSHFFNLNPNS